MPIFTIDILRKIWLLRNDGAILPLHNSIPGHPILVPKPCLMQTIQRSNAINTCQVLLMGDHYSTEIENIEIILDIDTPDDFITMKERYTEVQKTQLDDCVQMFNPSSTHYYDDKESLVPRKEEN